MRTLNSDSCRRSLAFALAAALAMAPVDWAKGTPISVTFSAAYALPGGTMATGVGAVDFDTTTGTSTGSINFAATNAAQVVAPIIPIVACLLLCWLPKLLMADASTGPSLLEQALGDLSGSMVSDFGPAGVGTFTSHLQAGNVVLTGDLTGIDFSLLPLLPTSFVASGLAQLGGTGPGTAAGTSVVQLSSQSISNSFGYVLDGNPSAAVAARRIQSTLTVTRSDDTHAEFSGQTTALAVSEPPTLALVALAACMAYSRRRRQALHS